MGRYRLLQIQTAPRPARRQRSAARNSIVWPILIGGRLGPCLCVWLAALLRLRSLCSGGTGERVPKCDLRASVSRPLGARAALPKPQSISLSLLSHLSSSRERDRWQTHAPLPPASLAAPSCARFVQRFVPAPLRPCQNNGAARFGAHLPTDTGWTTNCPMQWPPFRVALMMESCSSGGGQLVALALDRRAKSSPKLRAAQWQPPAPSTSGRP